MSCCTKFNKKCDEIYNKLYNFICKHWFYFMILLGTFDLIVSLLNLYIFEEKKMDFGNETFVNRNKTILLQYAYESEYFLVYLFLLIAKIIVIVCIISYLSILICNKFIPKVNQYFIDDRNKKISKNSYDVITESLACLYEIYVAIFFVIFGCFLIIKYFRCHVVHITIWNTNVEICDLFYEKILGKVLQFDVNLFLLILFVRLVIFTPILVKVYCNFAIDFYKYQIRDAHTGKIYLAKDENIPLVNI